MSKKTEDMTLEEKVDEILKVQKHIHRMAIAKTIISTLTFIILVVLPIVGFVYLSEYIFSSVGLSLEEVGDTLRRVHSLTDLGNMDTLKNLLN